MTLIRRVETAGKNQTCADCGRAIDPLSPARLDINADVGRVYEARHVECPRLEDYDPPVDVSGWIRSVEALEKLMAAY